MFKYEELSEKAKQGLEKFKQDLPMLFLTSNPELENYPARREELNAVFSDKHVKVFTYAGSVVMSYCMMVGATVCEAYYAAEVARSEKYWFADYIKHEGFKKYWIEEMGELTK